jgi:glycosyltransferase involved in cell wall biosynthesis
MFESISIVIPTLNGADTLPAVLEAIARQQIDVPVETIAVDSGSTDGTVALLQRHHVDVVTIPTQTFDHGLTRNLALDRAHGDLAVLLVQDAVPVSDNWLATLTAPFRADVNLAGTFARQEPRPDAGAITRRYHASYLAASACGRVVAIDGVEGFEKLSPQQRLDRCTFDNVCSCVRRSVWKRHPFRATPIGEDIAWAKDVLLAGHRLAYVPGAVVLHSHHRSVRYEFWRTVTLHRELFGLFQLRTVPSVSALLRATTSCVGLHTSLEPGARALGLAVAWPLGQYVGALSAARGWRMRRRKGV